LSVPRLARLIALATVFFAAAPYRFFEPLRLGICSSFTAATTAILSIGRRVQSGP
jgi:hypothetical protein